MGKLRCWWFGCVPDESRVCGCDSDRNYDYNTPCKRCDCFDVSYADMVGDTRHNRLKEWLRYWLFRRWIPAKCPDCGKRPYKPCDKCIPF